VAQQFCEALNKKDLKTVSNMLSDDLEVLDHVPYRFDNKEQFTQYVVGAMEGITTANLSYHQLSSRLCPFGGCFESRATGL
jgi:ketosteroid isomerase-like protein